VVNDVKNDLRAINKMHLPWWGLLCVMGGMLPICWLFINKLGRLDLVWPTAGSAIVLTFAIAVKRTLRRSAWFWITMTIIAAFHVLLILFVAWTSKWVPAIVAAAIGSADLIVILAVLSVVGNLVDAKDGDPAALADALGGGGSYPGRVRRPGRGPGDGKPGSIRPRHLFPATSSPDECRREWPS
jgi:hypothetical protein